MLFAVLFLGLCGAMAQETHLSHFDFKNGLHSRINYMISQDANGYLLVSSDNGLYRFDGVEFIKLNRGTDLENKEVLQAVSLSNGDLGLSLYFDNYFYVLKNAAQDSEGAELLRFHFPSSNYFEIVAVDQEQSSIYFAANAKGYLNLYRYQNNRVEPLLEDSAIWLSGFDSQRQIVYSKKIGPNNRYMTCELIDLRTKESYTLDIDYAKYGNVISARGSWIITQKGKYLHLFPKNSRKPSLYKTLLFDGDVPIFQYTEDDQGNLWVYNLKAGAWFYPLYNNREPVVKPRSILSKQFVNHVFLDKDRNVWFSTKNDGLYFMASSYYTSYFRKNIVPIEEAITRIKEFDNSLFLGLRKSGFIQYDFDNRYYRASFDSIIDETRDLFLYRQKLYLSQGDGRFWKYDRQKKEFSKILLRAPFLNDKDNFYFNFKSISNYKDPYLFLSNYEGLYQFNTETEDFKLLNREKSYTVLMFASDSVLFGSFEHLYKLRINDQEKQLIIPKVYFNEIKKLDEKTFVGASNTRGVIIFNSDQIIQEINQEHGLLSNQVLSVYVENPQTMWASSTQGLYRIQWKPSLQVRLFTEADGLFSNNVSGNIIHNGKNYIASNKGLTILPLAEMLKNKTFIPISTFINEVRIGKKVIYKPHAVETSFDRNTLQIHLSFLDYQSRGKIRFKYRLKGLDDQWRISNSNLISYSSIPPGSYVFEALGLGSNNLESYQAASFSLKVNPLYWQTLWFRLLMLLLLLSLIAYLIWIWRDKKIRRLEFDQKISELELQAIKAQFNPHFIYNCLNSIQYLVYKKSFAEAEDYLVKFSNMIRVTLNYSEQSFLSISEEIAYLKVYLEMEQMRFKGVFEYEIQVAEGLDTQQKIPSLLIQPYVENAVKHGISGIDKQVGRIVISFNQQGSELLIQIMDNGKGFQAVAKAEAARSFGLKLSAKRIETYNKLFHTDIRMEIDTEIGKFTKIKISINHV